MASFIVTRHLLLMVLLLSVLLAVVFELQLVWVHSLSLDPSDHDTAPPIEVASKQQLARQIAAQAEFQTFIFHKQHECKRLLVRGFMPMLPGFAMEWSYLTRLLQQAISTDRSLVITDKYKSAYTPHKCQFETSSNTPQHALIHQGGRGWHCLWEPISNCSEASIASNTTDSESPLLAGIVAEKSDYFNAHYYGPRPIIEAPSDRNFKKHFKETDIVPHWERWFGRYWIRSQMAHYMWKPSPVFQEQIGACFPKDLPERFIGFHIRRTDNVKDLRDYFGRDATVTRNITRFMDIANQIRQEHPDIDTIFLATDSTQVLEEIREYQQGEWKILVQQNVQRTNDTTFEWFKDGRSRAAVGIATDLEVLRRADFLVGSFQSNVYRMAAQLNTAWHVSRYPIFGMQRHFTVDVEWYEDP